MGGCHFLCDTKRDAVGSSRTSDSRRRSPAQDERPEGWKGRMLHFVVLHTVYRMHISVGIDSILPLILPVAVASR
jgi:hypothetical protein